MLRLIGGPACRAVPCHRPRELPIVEGQPMVGLELKRLGLKAAW